MVGEWEIADMEPCELPDNVARGFYGLFANMVGASYIPELYCGYQIVHGINYMIICKQTLATNPPVEHLVNLVINEPVPNQGGWTIVSIDPII